MSANAFCSTIGISLCCTQRATLPLQQQQNFPQNIPQVDSNINNNNVVNNNNMLNDQNYQNNNVEDGDLDENGEKQNICFSILLHD
jgi:hypothetical protein